jgi:hypothetical protein
MIAMAGLEGPRLILRIGGLGNRTFTLVPGGDDAARPKVDATVKEVYMQLGEAVRAVYDEERSMTYPSLPGNGWHWWESRLGWFFGKADRWQRQRLATAGFCPVFADEQPRIEVLTGCAQGGDSLLAQATAWANASGSPVEWQHRGLVLEHADADAFSGPKQDDAPYSIGQAPARKNADQKKNGTRAEAVDEAHIAHERAFGFRAQAEALRHHADLLVAIWDVASEGKPGGTRETVELALRERIPVIAIRIDEGGAVQRDLLFGIQDLWKTPGAAGLHGLAELVAELLAFPDATERPHHGTPVAYDPRVAFHAFCSGTIGEPSVGRFWRWYETGLKERASSIVLAAKAAIPGVEPHAVPAYEEAKSRASAMAARFGRAHRAGVLVSYVLGALAVCCAVLGGILHVKLGPSHVLIPIVAALELVSILLLFSLSRTSRSEAWHTAWTDLRILAEALRPMKYLHPLGVHTPLPKLAPHLTSSYTNPKQLWSIWYFRMLVKQVPIALSTLQQQDLASHRARMVQDWIGITEDPTGTGNDTIHEGGQLGHHQRNHRSYEATYHRLETVSLRLFLVIMSSAVLHLVYALGHWSWLHSIHDLLFVVCVLGPAGLAAILGFTSQLDMQRIAERSEGMQDQLRGRAQALGSIPLGTSPAGMVDPALYRWSLCTEAIATAGLMVDETAGWALIYRNTEIHAG